MSPSPTCLLTPLAVPVLFACLAAAPLHGQSRRLNAPLPTNGSFADVRSQRVSPDGAWVVFIADGGTDEVNELYSVPVDGSGPQRKLSGTMPASGDVVDFTIGPDSAFVVYRANQSVGEPFELYGGPIDGGAAVKLGPALIPGGDAQPDYAIDPSGTRLVYRSPYIEQFPLFVAYRLMSVPLDASSPPVNLFPELVSDGSIDSFGFASNGDVRFAAEQGYEGQMLERAPDGSGAARLLVAHPNAFIGHMRESLDGTRVVYSA